ncbi:MAG: NAD+ synthase [Thermoplasmatota archaeon]
MRCSKVTLDEYITIIHEFIRDKVDKTNSQGVVLGLSGGLDSATVLKLCIDSLGRDKVHCLIMPEKASPEEDMRDARWLAEEWGVNYDEIDIDKIMRVFPAVKDKRLANANLKTRIRMCVEYYHANISDKLVIGTSNKSEILLGYTTKYGDSAVDFLPIGDLYKSEVKDLAARIEVPSRFLDKIPRAGLWEGQTDEDEIGYTYKVIDKILEGFEKNRSLEDISKNNGVSLKAVRDIKRMVLKSAHKRKIPTICKLRIATVGKDWREFSH